jgi:hypothetical protein
VNLEPAVDARPHRRLPWHLGTTELVGDLRLVPFLHAEGVDGVRRDEAVREVPLAVDQAVAPHPPGGIGEREQFAVAGGFFMKASKWHQFLFRSEGEHDGVNETRVGVARAVQHFPDTHRRI